MAAARHVPRYGEMTSNNRDAVRDLSKVLAARASLALSLFLPQPYSIWKSAASHTTPEQTGTQPPAMPWLVL